MHANKLYMPYKDMNRKLVVVTTVTSWDEPPRIRHQVTRQLTKKYNVLYLQVNPFFDQLQSAHQENENLIIDTIGVGFRGMGVIFRLSKFIESIYYDALAKKIEKKIHDLGYKSALSFNFQFDFHQVFDVKLFEKKVFLLNDDFINMNEGISEKIRSHLACKQKKVANKADVLIAVSEPLVTQLSLDSKKANLVLPGVEFIDVPEALQRSHNFENVTKVAFMGYIDNRLSVDWLEFILNDSRVSLTLIGPMINKSIDERLAKFSNYQHFKSKVGFELAKCLTEFDVLIMPYDVNQQIAHKCSAPNKFFQYLAAGRPVVISDMRYFIDVPKGFVYIAKSKENFLEMILYAKNEDNFSLRKDRVEFASLNSWDNRGVELMKLIDY